MEELSFRSSGSKLYDAVLCAPGAVFDMVNNCGGIMETWKVEKSYTRLSDRQIVCEVGKTRARTQTKP